MKLFEYNGKEIFRKHGLPVPNSKVASTVEEAVAAQAEIGKKCVIKAQILSGGRGKAGGVKFASNEAETREAAGAILGIKLKDLQVNKVLVEECADIRRELYMSVMMDTEHKDVVVIMSASGGMEIENNADTLVKMSIGWQCKFEQFDVRNLLYKAGLETKYTDQISNILTKMVEVFKAYHATLVEINPLVITGEDKIIACDAKMNIDNNIIPYNEEIQAIIRSDPESWASELFKLENEFDYLDLDENGEIGLLSTGAGLTMAVVDKLKAAGASPCNFIDIRTGGFKGSTARLETALHHILAAKNVKVILVNVFGGITDLNEFAGLLVKALQKVEVKLPVVVRLQGNNFEAADETLKAAGYKAIESLDEAADEAIKHIGG